MLITNTAMKKHIKIMENNIFQLKGIHGPCLDPDLTKKT